MNKEKIKLPQTKADVEKFINDRFSRPSVSKFIILEVNPCDSKTVFSFKEYRTNDTIIERLCKLTIDDKENVIVYDILDYQRWQIGDRSNP